MIINPACRTLIDEVIFAALVDTMVQLLFIVRVWYCKYFILFTSARITCALF